MHIWKLDMSEAVLQMRREKIYYEVNAVRETGYSYGEKLKSGHYVRVYTMTNFR